MNGDRIRELLAYDRQHLWHPYTSMKEPLPVYLVERGEGATLTLADGRQVVDGMSSWWCAIHGYNHPVLNEALRRQAEKISHVMFGGITHEPAVLLGKKLIEMSPSSLERVFLADSGSVSVEAAIKMAIQYRMARGEPGRTRLLTVRGGYHGDTFGAMGVCDPEGGMHHLFTSMLPGHIFAERPSCRFDEAFDPASLDDLRSILANESGSISAIILEPIAQGAGGMWFYHPEYLRGVRKLCDDHGVLLILDEIATGFGRTGKLFACDWAGISPDIMCVGKALSGGYMTLAATLATAEVADTISHGGGVFNHGPTFMGNPLACAVANASLDLISTGEWEAQVRYIERWLEEGLSSCRSERTVNDVRVLGAIGVVEMKGPVDMALAQKFFVEKGVWIRPFGKLIYLMPPYISSEGEIGKLCEAVRSFVKK